MERTAYVVPAWGRGTLWTERGTVIAHEFDFRHAPGALLGQATAAEDPKPRAAPFKGALGPPTGTLASPAERKSLGSASSERKRALETGSAQQAVDAEGLTERFRAFLAGRDAGFDDVPLDLSWCTPFQRAVTLALRSIPRGDVVTYGELAALAGYPGAQRAAGSFCSQNRFMFLLPCHRVVAAGGVGGYGAAGTVVKRRLLALEGVCV